MAELDAQDGALQSLHAIVVTFYEVMIFALLSPVAQHPYVARVFGVIRHHHSSLTISAQILTGINTETAQVTDAAHSSPLVFCAMSLSRVLDDNQIMTPGNFQNGIHIGRLAVEMNGYD